MMLNEQYRPATAAPRSWDLRAFHRLPVLGDIGCFVLSGFATYAYIANGAIGTTWATGLILIGALVFTLALEGSRASETLTSKIQPKSIRLLVQSTFVAFALLAITVIVVGIDQTAARSWLITWFAFAVAVSISYRLILSFVVRAALRGGKLNRRIAVYGGDEIGASLLEYFSADEGSRAQILGFYDERRDRVPDHIVGYTRLGGLDALEAAAFSGQIDEVVIALPLSASSRVGEITNRLADAPVTILVAPDLKILQLFDRPIEEVFGVPMLQAMNQPIEGWGRIVKFLQDRLIAGLILILASPLFLAIAIAIKLSSKGPVIFRQTRRGWNGSAFEILKFRTMRVEAAQSEGLEQAHRDDPRVTTVGWFLRRTSFDELPQLINVLRGDMSLVGPRPHAMGTRAEGRLFEESVEDYMRRYRVKPGMTGWAQVHGWRGETDSVGKLAMRVRYDIEYTENWSLWLDLYILMITPLALLFRSHNAY